MATPLALQIGAATSPSWMPSLVRASPLLNYLRTWGQAETGGASFSFEAKTGQKLGQQIARWRSETGSTGGMKEFFAYANSFAASAQNNGTVVTGTVGTGPNALHNATIYRNGNSYLMVQDNKIMSYVPNAEPGRIVDEYRKLGGK